MDQVYIRIKRFGDQWAACGIPLAPPKNRRHEPNIKYLCPKLVPGQVVAVDSDSNTLKQRCIEIVHQLEEDEIVRPLVFNSVDDAIRANPSSANFDPKNISNGMNLLQTSIGKQQEKLIEREEQREANPDEIFEDMSKYLPTHDEDGDPIVGNPNNAILREEKEKATPLVTEITKSEDKPPVRNRRKKRS